jgi:hypothetical protein
MNDRVSSLSELILSTLMMESILSSETSSVTIAKRRRIPEYGILHSHRSENLKYYNIFVKNSVFWNVALVRTDISEESIASVIRVTGIIEIGTLAVTRNRNMLQKLLTRATLCNIPKEDILHGHRRENLKS